MKNNKKTAALMCIVMATAAVAAGCGSSGASGNASSSASQAASSSAGASDSANASTASAGESGSQLSGNLNIWAWGADDEAKSRDAAIQVFIKEHPELKVDYTIIPTANSTWDQKASAALSSGSAGDVMQMSPDYYGMNTTWI